MNLQKHQSTLETRPGDSFRYARALLKPYGELDRVLARCKPELIDEWRWQLIDGSTDKRPGRYIFYFDSDRDFFAFVLQWS